MGMVGRMDRLASGAECRLLWGDSQAEGVCVADDQKLHVQLKAAGLGNVLPMGRSGDWAVDWWDQMPRVERHLRAEGFGEVTHLWLVCETSDLRPQPRSTAGRTSTLAFELPALVVEAARRMIENPRTGQRRGLRFWVGPEAEATKGTGAINRTEPSHRSHRSHRSPWSHRLEKGQFNLIILDAREPGDDVPLADWIDAPVIDCRPALAAVGPFPARGFHNGTPGEGHLNAAGYRAIAAAAAAAWPE